jgi:RNA polymerase sigma factor (sigma-70 family)
MAPPPPVPGPAGPPALARLRRRAATITIYNCRNYAQHGTLCPDRRDPVGWSKTVIRNYLTDQWRRRQTQRKHSDAYAPTQVDIAEDITDQIIAGKARAFVETLEEKDHMIAMMAWIDGLAPKQIAKELSLKDFTVRKSLHKTRKKLRAQFGVTEGRKISEEETK